MGVCASRSKVLDLEDETKKETIKRDNRKRNSHVFALTDFIDLTSNRPCPPPGSDLPPLGPVQWETIPCFNAGAQRVKDIDWSRMDPRLARANKTADSIASGNMRTVREQVIGHFGTINRPFTAHWDGDTILHIACREGFYDMVEFMFNPKNRSIFDTTSLIVDIENTKGRTPLMLAFTPPSATFSAGKGAGLDSVSGLPIVERPEEVTVASDWIKPGSEKQRQDIVLLLIREGADVNKLDYHNYSSLHVATIWGWLAVVKVLLDKGANPEAIDVLGSSPLHLSCVYNRLAIAEHLITETGVTINARNVNGDTPLFVAVRNQNLDIVECLLAYDADVNDVNYEKLTPLKIACKSQNVSMTHMLLDFKVQRRKSAFDLLEGPAHKEIMRRLEDDEREAREAAEAQMKGKNRGTVTGGGMTSSYGAWTPFLDKKSKEVFYYNKVSRECQWEEPKDYTKDITYVMKRSTFGMHFYH